MNDFKKGGGRKFTMPQNNTKYRPGDVVTLKVVRRVFIVNSGGMECLADCIFNFTDGKVFPLSITLNNTNLSVIHCLKN